MSKNLEKGIKDLDAKLALWRALLRVPENLFLREVAQGDQNLMKAVAAGTLRGRLRKWKPVVGSTPKDDLSRLFFARLAEKLPTRGSITGELLISISAVEFASYLPDEYHKVAQLTLKQFDLTFSPDSMSQLTNARPNYEIRYPIWVYDTSRPEAISKGVEKRQIDQKHYYMDPDSAEAWNTLIGRNTYGSYLECLDSLRDLVDGSEWKNIVNKKRPGTVVMLAGGGAPTKDMLLLESLLENWDYEQPLRYFLMDVSCYMLEYSRRSILQNARVLDLVDKFSIELIKSDILEMSAEHRQQLRENSSSPVLFAITGGTIGNLNEGAFFSSLRRVSAPGDILIISADTFEESAGARAALRERYDNKDLRRFIRPVVRSVVNETNPSMNIDQALENVTIKILENDKARSEVSESLTVVADLALSNVKLPITLFTSTRYKSEQLTDYADRHGWELICQVASREHPHSNFRQFLFVRNS